MKNRFVIKFGGESGQGINSVGEIFAKSLKRSGYKIFAYREYPSLIQGGFASYQLDFSDQELNSSSKNWDLAICLSRLSIHKLLKGLNEGGVLIHGQIRVRFEKEEKEFIENNNIKIIELDSRQIVKKLRGPRVTENSLLSAIAWNLLGFDSKIPREIFAERFKNKQSAIDINMKVMDYADNYDFGKIEKFKISYEKTKNNTKSLLIDGNKAMALGAISAGVRAFYAYPMTPASSILSYLANVYKETKMLVKQVEDEITAIQMTLGSMHMGTRALFATSGGGFDLMTESFSMAGITEIPLVGIIAQRPGPATGVPTWTGAQDLNIAVYAGHGEYPRCVISASDAISAYKVIQKAFNIAERFQIPVLVLTEKQIAESYFLVDEFPEPEKIERGLVERENLDKIKSEDRYKITEDGISPRWLPGSSDQTYNANADEHFAYGYSTEDAEEIGLQVEKRMKKLEVLKDNLPEPELFGEDEGEILYVGWGSVKNTVLDAMKISDKKISYLHYEVVFPIKAKTFVEIKYRFKKVILIENNYQGQLGNLIKLECGFEFDNRLLKYDGRPFFVEEINEMNN